MLVRVAVWVIVQAFYVAIDSSERDVVEAADGKGGLGVGGCNEAFF